MLLKKKLIIGTVLLIIAVIIYSFLWGRLFPFSPIIIGFEQKEFNKAIIYYRKDTDISKFIIIDSLTNEVEDFHQLKLKKKVKIFIFNSDKEYTRHTGKKTRFVVFPLLWKNLCIRQSKNRIRRRKNSFGCLFKT